MKKVLVLILIIFSIVCIVGCSGNDDKGNDKNPDLGTPDSGIIDDNEQEDNKNPDSCTPDSGNPDNNEEEDIEVDSQLKSEELTEDLKNTFVSAYVKSLTHEIETVDENNIFIDKYYGTIGKAHIVSMHDNYSDVYPNDAYIEKIKNLEFGFIYTTNTYVIFNGVLYTPKQAFEEKIINLSDLCLLFGLHTAGLDTFTINDYNNIMSHFGSGSNSISVYYGKYNGYCAVTLSYSGMQAAVIFEENYHGLTFSYGYQSSRIRLINKGAKYTLDTALENNVISKENLYDLFEMYSKSAEINDQIIEKILTAAYNLCLKYKDNFWGELKFEDLGLTKYYGKHGASHIFDMESSNLITFPEAELTSSEKVILQWGFNTGPYVLNNNVLYTIYGALDKGIITEELCDQLSIKYFKSNKK